MSSGLPTSRRGYAYTLTDDLKSNIKALANAHMEQFELRDAQRGGQAKGPRVAPSRRIAVIVFHLQICHPDLPFQICPLVSSVLCVPFCRNLISRSRPKVALPTAIQIQICTSPDLPFQICPPVSELGLVCATGMW